MACKSNNRKGNKRGQLALAAAAVGLSALGMVQSAQAANYTWNGADGATWDTTGVNWGGTASNIYWSAVANGAYFNSANSGGTVTVNGSIAATSVYLSSGASTSNYTLSGGGTLTTTNGFYNQSTGGTLTIATNVVVTASALGINQGYVEMTSGSITDSNAFAVGGGTLGATFTQSGGVLNANRGSSAALLIGTSYTANNLTSTYNLNSGNANISGTGGVYILNGNSTYTGCSATLNIGGGTMSVPNNLYIGNAGTGGGTATLNLTAGELRARYIQRATVNGTAIFDFSGGTLRPYSGGALTVGSATAANNVALTLTGSSGTISSTDSGSTNQAVGVYSVIGEDAAGRGLTFAGGGTTTLYANNTYTGETKIATTGSGKVTLANNGGTSGLSSSSTLHVVGGATFADGYTTGRDLTFAGLKSSGTGTASITLGTTGKKVIAGAVNMQDGNIDTLSITNGGLSLNSGSILNFDLGTSNTSDLVSLTGALTVNGNLNLSLTGNGAGNGTYKLFGFTSQTGFTGGTITSVGGTAGSITLAGVTGLTNKKYVFSATGSEIDLAISDNAAYTKALLGLSGLTAPARMISGGTVNVSAVVSNNNSASDADTLTWSANNSATGGLTFTGSGVLSGGGSTTVTGSFTSSTTGQHAITVAAGGTSTNLNEAVTGGTASANIAVLDLRSIAQSGQVDAGRLMKGSSKSFSGTASLTTSGDDDHYTRLSVQGVSGTVNAAGTYSASVSGTVSAASGQLNSLTVSGENLAGEGSYGNVAIAYNAQVFNPIELVASSSYNAFNSGSNTVSVSGSNGNYVFTPATNATGTQQAFVTVDTSKATGFAAPEFVLLALKDVTLSSNHQTAVDVVSALKNAGLEAYSSGDLSNLAMSQMLADWSGYAHYKNGSFTEDFDVLVKFGSIGGDKLAFDFSQIDGGAASVSAIGVVPEPTSLGLMALPALGLLARRRRAMKKA